MNRDEMRAAYVRPEISTMAADEVFEILGPAQGYGIGGGHGLDMPVSPAGAGMPPQHMSHRRR